MSSIQAGDVVVCVNAKPCPVYGEQPLRGDAIYRVVDVKAGRDINTGVEGVGLKLDRHNDPQGRWHAADRFRKVQKASDSFIAQIKACRPKHDRVPHNVESDRG